MKQFHKVISDYGIASRVYMFALLWLIIEMVFWSMESDRDGMEIAAIMGATLTPIVALVKFVMEWADRKNESHT